jgi:hypothetical protein
MPFDPVVCCAASVIVLELEGAYAPAPADQMRAAAAHGPERAPGISPTGRALSKNRSGFAARSTIRELYRAIRSKHCEYPLSSARR